MCILAVCKLCAKVWCYQGALEQWRVIYGQLRTCVHLEDMPCVGEPKQVRWWLSTSRCYYCAHWRRLTRHLQQQVNKNPWGANDQRWNAHGDINRRFALLCQRALFDLKWLKSPLAALMRLSSYPLKRFYRLSCNSLKKQLLTQKKV